ncbi:toll-like receptor 2 [Huso huso]|uniref:Monocyte differentiation antigen CD14 n=1 Tax=Huso huso TaxID=61971 RepID=A0ABR0Y1T0_HUSHU
MFFSLALPRISSMPIIHLTLVLFLLYGSRTLFVKGVCVFDEEGSHCTCQTEDIRDLMGLFTCAQAEVFEIQNGYLGISPNSDFLSTFGRQGDFRQMMDMLKMLPVNKIIFKQITVSNVFLSPLLSVLPNTNIREIVLINSTVEDNQKPIVLLLSSSLLTSVTVVNGSLPSSYLLPNSSYLHSWVMSSIKRQCLSSHKSPNLSVPFIRHLKSLEELDLSENELSDGFIDLTECPDAFKKLSTLKLSHNRFQTYKDVCHSLENLTSLVDLDLSHNDFSVPPSACSWHQMFGVFNLSDTKLQQIQNYLPSKVEVLDLSNNNLLLFSASPQGLRELYLSNNGLLVLPALHDMPNLQILQIDGNDLTTFSERDIEDLKQLHAVTAGRNSFHCDCSSKDTTDSLVKMSSILKDWPDDYVCGSSSLRQGTHVKDLNLSFFVCHTALVLSLICVGSLIVISSIAGLVCYKVRRARKQGGGEAVMKYDNTGDLSSMTSTAK